MPSRVDLAVERSFDQGSDAALGTLSSQAEGPLLTEEEDVQFSYAHHPRYGNRPRMSGLNPNAGKRGDPNVRLLHHSGRDVRVSYTAIAANLEKQSFSLVPATHYFDARRTCEDCQQPFLFFAEEQKYWYEELGFPLSADCLQCFVCRKERRGIERDRQRFAELHAIPERSMDEELELAECYAGMCEGNSPSNSPGKRLMQIRGQIQKLEPRLSPAQGKRLHEVVARLTMLVEQRAEPGPGGS